VGPPHGRYVLRGQDGEPEAVVVLTAVGAPPAPAKRARRRPRAIDHAPVSPVGVTRVTVARAKPHESEGDAEERLSGLADAASQATEIAWAQARLNRLVGAHRLAAADPWVPDAAEHRALSVRAGYGSGEQVAEGMFERALDLTPARSKRRSRSARGHDPDTRLVDLLAGREHASPLEELVLRARADLAAGRTREAALQARIAAEAARYVEFAHR